MQMTATAEDTEIDSIHVCVYDAGPLPIDETQMAFSEENQRWILEKIHEATRPNGFKKVANWLRYWSLLGVGITVFLALIAMAISLGLAAFNRGTIEAEFRGTTKKELEGIGKRLGDIEKSLLALRVAQAASSPTNGKSIFEARALLNTARENAIKLPEDVVRDSGAAFIEAAAKQPGAWNTAVDFLNYRSTLNVYSRKVDTVSVPNDARTLFELGQPVEGKPLPILMHVAAGVAPKDAARFETIGHNLNEKLAFVSSQRRSHKSR
jgi:hypothetical protein